MHAAQLYRRLGRMTLRAVSGGEYQTVVWYTPRRGGRVVRAWLQGLRVSRFRPQVEGDLGERLAATLAGHFSEGARRVVVVGSDCPGVSRELVWEAFASLGQHDVVLGPAHDGGYYLIGMNTPRPELFQGIPWSSNAVTARTLDAARALGLSCSLLRPLRDIDTAADARALGLVAPAHQPASVGTGTGSA